MNQLLTAILKETYTKNSLLKRIRLTKDLTNFIFFHLQQPELSLEVILEKLLAVTPQGVLKTQVEANKDWLLSLGDGFFKQFNSENINNIFATIQSETDQLKPVFLYLPFEIYERETLRLGQWFKQNVAPEAIFEIFYSPELVGGCTLAYNGVVKDYSIKTRVEANRDSLLNELKNIKHAPA